MDDNQDGSVLESVKGTISSKLEDAIPKNPFDNYQVNLFYDE